MILKSLGELWYDHLQMLFTFRRRGHSTWYDDQLRFLGRNHNLILISLNSGNHHLRVVDLNCGNHDLRWSSGDDLPGEISLDCGHCGHNDLLLLVFNVRNDHFIDVSLPNGRQSTALGLVTDVGIVQALTHFAFGLFDHLTRLRKSIKEQ